MLIDNRLGTFLAIILFVLIFLFIKWINKQTKKCETKKKKK